MKVIRKTLWNRMFHKKQLQKQRQEMERLQQIIDKADDYIEHLEKCNDLRLLLNIHKDMWGSGLRNKNIGPNEFGMFRTKDIPQMKAEEVYLGDIYGLWTFTIPEWEKEKEHKYGDNGWGINPDTTVYELIVRQYRHHLISNVKAIRKEAEASLALLKL